jgi:hypothetical protein
MNCVLNENGRKGYMGPSKHYLIGKRERKNSLLFLLLINVNVRVPTSDKRSNDEPFQA